jgi:hypothetical protein
MATLIIAHTVPFVGRDDSAPLLLYQFLPEDPASAIVVRHPDMTVTIRVDRECVDSFHGVSDELLRTWVNIKVLSVRVAVEVTVAGDLAHFIEENEHWQRGKDLLASEDPETRRLAEEYGALGRNVHLNVLKATNRLASWAYAERGHYWLYTRPENSDMMPSDNVGFGARVTIDGGGPKNWFPPGTTTIRMYNPIPAWVVRREDWATAADFVAGSGRPDGTREILSNAFGQLDNGYARGAVAEAVAALESALNKFAQRPRREALRSDRSFDALTFSDTVAHLGFSTSIAHLLPLLLPSTVLVEGVLRSAEAAIVCRNNILHNQQRDLSSETARSHVAAVKKLVDILQDATAPRSLGPVNHDRGLDDGP